MNVLKATNLTTNSSEFISLETETIQAENLRAETIETVTAAASGTLTSPEITASSAVTNQLRVGTRTDISDT